MSFLLPKRPLPLLVIPSHLFGLDEGSNPFLVDLPTLKKRFRDAQAACHPDTWAPKSPVYFFYFPTNPLDTHAFTERPGPRSLPLFTTQ